MSTAPSGKNATERAKLYKNANRAEDARRRRADASIELRKQKKDDLLMKRRNINVNEPDDEGAVSSEEVVGEADNTEPKKLTLDEVVHLVNTVEEPTGEQLRTVVVSLRRILSGSKKPPLDRIVEAGLGSVIIKLLSVPDELVVFEALWALTNILSGDSHYVRRMIAEGCLPPVQQHMLSKSPRVAEQATWAIANVFGDSPDLRDECIKAGILNTIGELMRTFGSLSTDFQKTLSWVLSNIVRHRTPNQCSLEVAQTVIQYMFIVFSMQDRDSLRDCFWGISYLSDTTPELVDVIVTSGLVPYLIHSLSLKITELIPPTLRALGNIVAGEDRHTQAALDAGLLAVPSLVEIFTDPPTAAVRKEVLWMLSNVAAGTPTQMHALASSEWLARIMYALRHYDAKAQVEASFAVANLTHNRDVNVCAVMCHAQFVSVAAAVVDHGDARVSINVLETLQSLFDTVQPVDGELYAACLEIFESEGGVDKIEALQEHDNNEVYTKALHLITSHFDTNEDDAAALNPENTSEPKQSSMCTAPHQSRRVGQPMQEANFNFE